MKIKSPYKLTTKKIRLSLNKYNMINFLSLCKKKKSSIILKNLNLRSLFFGKKKIKFSIDILLFLTNYSVSLKQSIFNIRYKNIFLNKKYICNNYYLNSGDMIKIKKKNLFSKKLNRFFIPHNHINDNINKCIYYL